MPLRKLDWPLAITEQAEDGQQRLSVATVDPRKRVWEFGALVTSLDAEILEILTLGQLHRDSADGENDFDELKNQWGWGGFTTQDLKHCRLMARFMALVFNWWTLFARLADREHHREAITSRPLPLMAVGRQTAGAGQMTIRVGSPHARHPWARATLTRINAFLETLRSTAEQLTPIERWCRIVSEALVKGWQLVPPRIIPAV